MWAGLLQTIFQNRSKRDALAGLHVFYFATFYLIEFIVKDVLHFISGRMQNWLKLARLAVEAEFPADSVLNAMSVFSVKGEAIRGEHKAQAERHLQRVAQVLKLDFDALKVQFMYHHYISSRIFAEQVPLTCIAFDNTDAAAAVMVIVAAAILVVIVPAVCPDVFVAIANQNIGQPFNAFQQILL